MNDTTTVPATPQTDAEYAAAIERCLEATRRLRDVMAEDQKEIERLRAETRAKLARMQAP